MIFVIAEESLGILLSSLRRWPSLGLPLRPPSPLAMHLLTTSPMSATSITENGTNDLSTAYLVYVPEKYHPYLGTLRAVWVWGCF